MEKRVTCDTCKANRVCDHNRFGFETCGNYIPSDVVPRSEEGAECPVCYGTGRIKTSDWLTKHLSKKRLAEEKAKANAEYEQHIKAEVAREIFAELDDFVNLLCTDNDDRLIYSEIKKKYLEDRNDETDT